MLIKCIKNTLRVCDKNLVFQYFYSRVCVADFLINFVSIFDVNGLR